MAITSEKLLEQARIIEEAEDGQEAAPNLGVVKQALFDAAEEMDRLNATVKELEDKGTKSQKFVALGEKKVEETKSETLRLLKAVCEHDPSKDMGKHDRMKERFEKETLEFEAIERYRADAQAEFDKIFPPDSRSKGGDPEDKPGAGTKELDVSAFKIKSR